MGGMGVLAPARRWGQSPQMSHLSPTPGTGAPPDSHLTPSQIAPQGPCYMAKTPLLHIYGLPHGARADSAAGHLFPAGSSVTHRPPPPPSPPTTSAPAGADHSGYPRVSTGSRCPTGCRVTPVVFRHAEDKIQLMISREARAYYEYVPCCSPR